MIEIFIKLVVISAVCGVTLAAVLCVWPDTAAYVPGLESKVEDLVYAKEDGWYFRAYTDGIEWGPYETEQIARVNHRNYLLIVDEGDMPHES